MTSNVQDVVGYFVWIRTQSGKPTYEKIGKDIYEGKSGTNPPGYKDYNAKIIGSKVALTADEWKMDLDMLAARYPCPPTPSSER